eukprot:761286-Hanusia_phi.AAC.5
MARAPRPISQPGGGPPGIGPRKYKAKVHQLRAIMMLQGWGDRGRMGWLAVGIETYPTEGVPVELYLRINPVGGVIGRYVPSVTTPPTHISPRTPTHPHQRNVKINFFLEESCPPPLPTTPTPLCSRPAGRDVGKGGGAGMQDRQEEEKRVHVRIEEVRSRSSYGFQRGNLARGGGRKSPVLIKRSPSTASVEIRLMWRVLRERLDVGPDLV